MYVEGSKNLRMALNPDNSDHLEAEADPGGGLRRLQPLSPPPPALIQNARNAL